MWHAIGGVATPTGCPTACTPTCMPTSLTGHGTRWRRWGGRTSPIQSCRSGGCSREDTNTHHAGGMRSQIKKAARDHTPRGRHVKGDSRWAMGGRPGGRARRPAVRQRTPVGGKPTLHLQVRCQKFVILHGPTMKTHWYVSKPRTICDGSVGRTGALFARARAVRGAADADGAAVCGGAADLWWCSGICTRPPTRAPG